MKALPKIVERTHEENIDGGETGPFRKLIQANKDTEGMTPHGVKCTADEVLKPCS